MAPGVLTTADVAPRAAGSLRGRFVRMFDRAMEQNLANIESMLATRPGGILLDLGCDDGANTTRFAAAARAAETHGLELIEERAEEAAGRGVQVRIGDPIKRFPFDDRSFDVVVSNQVIEHLCDTDNFVRESYRVLRPGGLAVVSTENLASWHNIGALMFGWQPFSLTNVSDRRLGDLQSTRDSPRGTADARLVAAHARVRVPGSAGTVRSTRIHRREDQRGGVLSRFPRGSRGQMVGTPRS